MKFLKALITSFLDGLPVFNRKDIKFIYELGKLAGYVECVRDDLSRKAERND